MPLFQYIGEGHTLIFTKKYSREKVKVAYGEIVEIEEGVHAAGRLIMAGFQLIEDGVEAAKDAVVDGVKDAAEVVTGSDLDGDGKIADTPVETAEAAPAEVPAETPAVEVTTEVVDDGSKDITLEVTTDEPKVDGSEGTDVGAESNAAAEGAEGTTAPSADEVKTETTEAAPTEAPKKATPPLKKK